jgi:hypothetical protein
LLSALTLPAQQFPDASVLIRRNADALKSYTNAEFSTESRAAETRSAVVIGRFYALTKLAKNALDAGFAEEAQSYANETLAMASQYPRDWSYGNAVYAGNTVLGPVALRSNT